MSRQPPKRNLGVFLSYARNDAPAVESLERALDAAGLAVWCDREKLYTSPHWPKALGEVVADNDALVLVWSQEAAASRHLELEWCTALALGKPVVPYLTDDTPLPAVLSGCHGIEAKDPAKDALHILAHLQSESGSGDGATDWLLGALERIEPSEPEATFRTVRELLSSAASTAIGQPTRRPDKEDHSLFSPGAVVGERYEIRGLLGEGGMGEVWRAFDLKLRVEVALKVLHGTDAGARDQLRREVRVAREVISPNVCRIFDLGEAGDTEFLSMEYVDGRTLARLMAEEGPLGVDQASPLASQMLAGLQAIHEAGLVHRDIKPENLMVTRTGRLVVMDLGLARWRTDDAVFSVSGTPAYLAPEQLRGETVDARCDLYAVGVVLAELTAPDGARNLQERQAVWRGLQRDPPQLSETPWAPALAQAVARDPTKRPASAQALARVLEKETVKTISDAAAQPYPGLAAFTEADAEYFFGREAEVEALWKKLKQQPRLLAVVGPSGAGKSSFLRAGVIAARPPEWSTLAVMPGGSPLVALGQALARVLADDRSVAEKMVRFSEPDVAVELIRRWRQTSSDALLIVDQFEELFTQNPPEVQAQFAELLGRLPLEADVHVLLGMRDDFLYHCHQYPALAPILSELTLLGPPTGDALRRALVQPALKCGFRFEDETLVDEMVAEVEGEWGALPLLAFAAAELWARRDREQGLLTRAVYEEIGGVAGALAGHAEATLESIGQERLPLVRELFRNLVTAQGTRAERDREELLSVFPEADREAAAEVLAELIDARLLVSHEEEHEEKEHHRIEIIHESLLESWPRLVRWRTQDADAAQMRDQLRQAAHMWDERDRSEDLLWSGTAYREFELWRERYAGRLTDTEQAFAKAMVDLAKRKYRRRRNLVLTGFAALLAISGVVVTFWRQAETSLLESEAHRLAALGRHFELERNPSGAIAYAIASLESADTEEARRLALEALWKGPTALVLEEYREETKFGGPDDYLQGHWSVDFSPDGKWLAEGRSTGHVILYHESGELGHIWKAHELATYWLRYGHDASVLYSYATGEQKVWSLPNAELLIENPMAGAPATGGVSRDGVSTVHFRNGEARATHVSLRRPGLEHLEIEIPPVQDPAEWLGNAAISPDARWFVAIEDQKLMARRLDKTPVESVEIAVDVERIARVVVRDNLVAVADLDGTIQLFSLDSPGAGPLLAEQGPPDPSEIIIRPDQRALFSRNQAGAARWWRFGSQGVESRAFELGTHRIGFIEADKQTEQLAISSQDGIARLWPLRGPEVAAPTFLKRGRTGQVNMVSFHPSGDWLATAAGEGLTVWPLRSPSSRLLWRHGRTVVDTIFAPDGSWVAASGRDNVRVWSMGGERQPPSLELRTGTDVYVELDVDEAGQWILAGSDHGHVKLLSLETGEEKTLAGFENKAWRVSISEDGRFAAATAGPFDVRERVIRVWEVESGQQVSILEPDHGEVVTDLEFCGRGDDLGLYSSSAAGIRKWDLRTGAFERVTGRGEIDVHCMTDQSLMGIAKTDDGMAMVIDLQTDTETLLERHGRGVEGWDIHPEGDFIVTGDRSGAVRVGTLDCADPHILFGHSAAIENVAIDPTGKWIASTSQDQTLRVWPVPDLSRRPFHTLPHEEFLDRLRALTNYRVVPDEGEQFGFKVTLAPFPGWETGPEWW